MPQKLVTNASNFPMAQLLPIMDHLAILNPGGYEPSLSSLEIHSSSHAVTPPSTRVARRPTSQYCQLTRPPAFHNGQTPPTT